MLILSASKMCIRFLLLIHIICYDFFGSMCCKRHMEPGQFGVCATQHPPHHLHLVGASHNATQMSRMCTSTCPRKEALSRSSRGIGRGSRGRGHCYKPNSPKQNHPKLHLPPMDQLKLQLGAFAIERTLTPPEQKRRRWHLVGQNRGCKGQRRS